MWFAIQTVICHTHFHTIRELHLRYRNGTKDAWCGYILVTYISNIYIYICVWLSLRDHIIFESSKYRMGLLLMLLLLLLLLLSATRLKGCTCLRRRSLSLDKVSYLNWWRDCRDFPFSRGSVGCCGKSFELQAWIMHYPNNANYLVVVGGLLNVIQDHYSVVLKLNYSILIIEICSFHI